ncbi:unnamed protein product [Rotaria sp. Silwood1]|nr:unnamed protein product [Rotaria sp. Silwood1]
MHIDHGRIVWLAMKRLSDGTYQHNARWTNVFNAIFSIYPVLTYESFNQVTVMFKHVVFTGGSYKRSNCWGIHQKPNRLVDYYSFNIEEYRRAYLAFSEWILNNFELHSIFELTSIQKKLQESHKSEQVPFYYEQCQNQSFSISSIETIFSGEYIAVMNRAGIGRRELTNADELVEALLKAFPDHKNPYLRVWPKQFNFNDDLYETACMARSIGVLIGVLVLVQRMLLSCD